MLTLGLILSMMSLAIPSAQAVDLPSVERQLVTTGVEGWIHGSASAQGLFVFTYRTPGDFFDNIQMSLVALSPDLVRSLSTFHRNDKVRVKGSFLPNPSPQKHVLLSAIELLAPAPALDPVPPYEHEAKIPDDLAGLREATFLVHAVGGGGQILVVEYKDAVLPVYVQNTQLTRSLWRGDLVRLAFGIQSTPGRPTHLNLDESAAQPVQVIEAVRTRHGRPASIEGELVLFPKSPEILFNVFAVRELLVAGLNRQYTLVNFTDPVLFRAIREKLQAAWDRHPGAYVNGRNKLVSTRIRVRASGVFNEQDPGQANPQVLLDSIESVEILE